jgi:3-oxoacyl-[acyl-carrier protein] reductase
MELRLRDKTALVTGASGGIGAATARLLAEEGANVVVSYFRNETNAEKTAESVRTTGRQGWLCRMDITDAAKVRRSLASLPDDARPLEILILCAGEAGSIPFDELTSETWRRIVDVNLNGTFNVLHAARPHLATGASVVIVSSVAAHTGVPLHAHYAAAKAGLVNLAKSAARAWAPKIRVNCVAPGMTLTEMGRQSAAALPADYAQTKLLTGRFAQPREIAHSIVFLASPAAAFIAGATLDINGGRDLR